MSWVQKTSHSCLFKITISPLTTAAPTPNATTDAEMVDQEADALLGADRTAMDDSETKASPAKRSRQVSSSSTLAAMDS